LTARSFPSRTAWRLSAEHFDLLLQHDVKVIRESQLRIRHNLIASRPLLDDIDRVFSHPVALAQCRNFWLRHPKMESFAFYDTAGSVKQLVELATACSRHRQRVGQPATTARRFWKQDRGQSGELYALLSGSALTPDARFDSDANKTSLVFSG